MFGAYPVGTYPYGGVEYPAGLFIVVLGQAQADIAGLNAVPKTSLVFGQPTTTADALDSLLSLTISIGQASATAQGLNADIKLLLSANVAGATASANDLSNLFISLGLDPANVDAQGFFAVPLSKLSTLSANSTAEGLDLVPKIIAQLVFAHAIASAESLGNLQVRIKIGRADADVDALDIQGLQRLDLGQGLSTAQSLDAATRIILSLSSGDMSAEALDLDNLSILMGLGQASLTASSFNATTKTYLEVGQALAQSQGIDFSGLKIGLFSADSLASVNTFGMGIPLITGGLSASAQGIVPLVKPELLAASSTIQAYEFEPMILNILIGEMIASAKDGDLTYIVTGVPDIIVTRSSDFTENELKVLNYNNENINIYRADDHRGIFELLEQAEVSPYTDSSLDKTLNYKYKAAFVITGTKGGVEVVVEGEKSNAIYTIGNKTL